MTKVRTILAEFCTPKEILAINRLGLLQKEERESQPIQWRHRLPYEERREMVRAEMRMNLHPTTRLTGRDKMKAINTAKNPKESKMGECLLNIHIRGDPSLRSHLGKIGREQRRLEHRHVQSRETFIKNSKTLNHEPLILVERPPSPGVREKAQTTTHHAINTETLALPRYMRPLLTKSKTPSTLITIDAFTVQAKKKRNIWEDIVDEKEGLRFKSTARPCARLTDQEVDELTIGYSLHKPTAESTVTTPRAEPGKDSTSSQFNLHPEVDGSSVFVTQLSQKQLAKKAISTMQQMVAHFKEPGNRKETATSEIRQSASVPIKTEIIRRVRWEVASSKVRKANEIESKNDYLPAGGEMS